MIENSRVRDTEVCLIALVTIVGVLTVTEGHQRTALRSDPPMAVSSQDAEHFELKNVAKQAMRTGP